ncbi:MAG TPA: group I intron-associated PD-(D/E)XK endonuclease [Pyrinomonadaceae bacterium]
MDEDYKTYKIQVKTTNSKNECVAVYSIKNCLNPKYDSTYTTSQVDIFAVYVIDKDLIFYVSAKEILKNSKNSKFRLSPSKNGQNKNVRYAKDYLNLKKALRDCTPHAQTAFAAGDETVQTTTREFFAANEN